MVARWLLLLLTSPLLSKKEDRKRAMVKDKRSILCLFIRKAIAFPETAAPPRRQLGSVYIRKSELDHLTTPSCKRNWLVPAFLVSEVDAGHEEGV